MAKKEEKEATIEIAQPDKKSYRQILAERFREEYPDEDVDYDDDDVFFSAMERYDDGRSKLIGGYEENSKKLSTLFNENPQAGAFITSLMNGSDVLDAIATSFGEDFENALKDPEGRRRYDEGIAKWRSDRDASEEILRKQQENADKYAEEVDLFFTGKNLSENEREDFAHYVSGLIDKLVTYEMTADVLESLWRGYKYDDAVAEAGEAGEIRGRNENIVMEKGFEDGTDGLPMTNRTGRDTPENWGYGNRTSIWDKV